MRRAYSAHRQQGFTLLELLIAMAIFTLLGLATYRVLDGVMRAEQRMGVAQRQLRQVQRALTVFERDLSQALAPVSAAASASLAGDAQSLAFTRGGVRNPRDLARSAVQRVSYVWRDQMWLRTTNDGVADGQPQTLLSGVTLTQLSYFGHDGVRHARWPPARSRAHLPAAIEIVFDAPGYPALRRVLLLPGVGGVGFTLQSAPTAEDRDAHR